MIEFVELTVFAIGMVTLLFIRTEKRIYQYIPEAGLFLLAFYFVLGGWFFSIVEGFLLKNLFNHVEHLLYALSNLTLSLWCYRVFLRKEM